MLDTIAPETEQGIREFAAALADPTALAAQIQQLIERGVLAGTQRPSAEELRSWYGVAAGMCDKHRFNEALPIALNLSLHAPMDRRHVFMLGSCLQRLGHPREAVEFFALSMHLEKHAATSFRLGECLAACEHIDDALRAFDQCAALARGTPELASVHEQAIGMAHALWQQHAPARQAPAPPSPTILS